MGWYWPGCWVPDVGGRGLGGAEGTSEQVRQGVRIFVVGPGRGQVMLRGEI